MKFIRKYCVSLVMILFGLLMIPQSTIYAESNQINQSNESTTTDEQIIHETIDSERMTRIFAKINSNDVYEYTQHLLKNKEPDEDFSDMLVVAVDAYTQSININDNQDLTETQDDLSELNTTINQSAYPDQIKNQTKTAIENAQSELKTINAIQRVVSLEQDTELNKQSENNVPAGYFIGCIILAILIIGSIVFHYFNRPTKDSDKDV